MLTQPEIVDVARDLRSEAEKRSYVSRILAEEFIDDPHSWELLIEMLEVVLHKRGFYIADESLLREPAYLLKSKRAQAATGTA